MRQATAILALLVLLAGCIQPPPPAAPMVHYAGLKIDTRLGSFTAILYANDAPATAAFVLKLVDAKYYEGRQFGRVIPGFVIQEVDRTGGTTDQKEHVKLEAPTNVAFSAGAFGIARDEDPDSGGSEFFVMDFPTSSLYGNYTAFAQVVDGLDVVHDIARQPAVRTGPASAVGSPSFSPVYFGVHDRVPVDPVVMTSVTRVDVALDAGIAARYPLRVGPSTTTATMRATMEWPRDLHAGASSPLTWYVASRDASPQGQFQDPPAPDVRGARVSIAGAGADVTLPLVEDARSPGILRWTWTPPASGDYAITLVGANGTIATTNVTVP